MQSGAAGRLQAATAAGLLGAEEASWTRNQRNVVQLVRDELATLENARKSAAAQWGALLASDYDGV